MTQNWDFWYENITSGNPGLPAMAFPVLLPWTPKGLSTAFERLFATDSFVTLPSTFQAGLPDFSRYNIPKREKNVPMATKCTKWPQHLPIGPNMYVYTKWYHLATLVSSEVSSAKRHNTEPLDWSGHQTELANYVSSWF
jgi:hypothetical protein